MNWEIEFTDQAKQDLRDILDYITYELQEPKVAVNPVSYTHLDVYKRQMNFTVFLQNLFKATLNN